MRPVEFGEALAVGIRLILFSADKPDRFFRVIKFWMDETSETALALRAGVLSLASRRRGQNSPPYQLTHRKISIPSKPEVVSSKAKTYIALRLHSSFFGQTCSTEAFVRNVLPGRPDYYRASLDT